MLTSAVLFAAKVTRILFTGVVALVPSVKDPQLVRVVVPNGYTNSMSGIPPHFAYVMFNMAQYDPSGRKPSLLIVDPADRTRTVGVCLINSEHLAIGGTFEESNQTPLCQPTKSDFVLAPCVAAEPPTWPFPDVEGAMFSVSDGSLHWLFDFERENTKPEQKLDTRLLVRQPDPKRVNLRMDLRWGRLATAQNSFDLRYAYRLDQCGTCQALSKAVGVTLVNPDGPAKLIIHSTPFAASSPPQRPLILTHSGQGITVVIGNEPIDAIESSIALLFGRSPHYHEDTSNHMQLMRRLLTREDVPVTTPAEIPAGACKKGLSPEVNGAGGGGGTCNPNGMRPADPPTG